MKKKQPEPDPKFGNTALRDALRRMRETPKPPPAPPKAPAAPPPPRQKKAAASDPTEEERLFRAAMHDVVPVTRGKGPTTEPAALRPEAREIDEEAEALAQLAELVATGEGFDLADTVEHVEGLSRGASRELLERLRRGDFSVQAHHDLHGLGVDQARESLERFLTESRRQGRRCVLVIHGRGLHSKDQNPVLKERVTAWLSRGKLARIVLAFATARMVDGGAGAMYVLLRR